MFRLWRPEGQLLLSALLTVPLEGGAAGLMEMTRDRIVGGQTLHTVKPGDSLVQVGARFGVGVQVLTRDNGLSTKARLVAGQTLSIDNRHVVPPAIDEGILVNVPQRLLFLFHEGALVAWYPVAVGRSDWQTAIGRFSVEEKERRPTWHVPVSIQKEMRRLGETVRTQVPPGPANPLGDYFIRLSGSACGIHGTNAPASIYSFRTHGCIRLHPDDIADLFPRISVGTPVWVAYEPFLLARRQDGSVFLEVNPDIYRRARNPRAAIDALAEEEGVTGALDETRVAEAVASTEGLARRVDRVREDLLQLRRRKTMKQVAPGGSRARCPITWGTVQRRSLFAQTQGLTVSRSWTSWTPGACLTVPTTAVLSAQVGTRPSKTTVPSLTWTRIFSASC